MAQTKYVPPSTVFVIDDDAVVLRRCRREYLQGTSLGVLTAEDLKTAVHYLEEGLPVGAVLADLNFRPETQYQERDLHNGLDLLAYIRKIRPEVPLYVMSMDAGDKGLQQMAHDQKVPIRDWYDKLAPRGSRSSPWARMERDLIVQALKAESSFQARAAELGESAVDLINDEKVAEKVRDIFNYPRLTYLQQLPANSPYALAKPLEVHCWQEDARFRVAAPRVPLLMDVYGYDVVHAIDNLSEAIVSEKKALDAAKNEGQLAGYALYLHQQLGEYLADQPAGGSLK